MSGCDVGACVGPATSTLAAAQTNGLDVASFWVTLVGTVATVAALVVAIVLGVHEVRALRRENDERADEQRARDARQRRQQAESISAYIEIESRLTAAPQIIEELTWVLVTNPTQLPIWDVRVHYPPPGPERAADSARADRAIPIIPGGDSRRVHIGRSAMKGGVRGEPVEVWFRDAGGVTWRREADGQLSEVVAHLDGHLTFVREDTPPHVR